MTITEPQADALANLLHEVRPDWPAKSLLTLIGKNRDAEFAELCTVAVEIATDSRNQTPAVIFLELGRRSSFGPWTKEFHHLKTAAEKRLDQGRMNHDMFAQMDAERAAGAVVPAGYKWANR